MNFYNKKLIHIYLIYSSRTTDSTANDLITRSAERPQEPIINRISNDQMVGLKFLTKSNEESPKHHHSLSTPTNYEQSNNYKE